MNTVWPVTLRENRFCRSPWPVDFQRALRHVPSFSILYYGQWIVLELFQWQRNPIICNGQLFLGAKCMPKFSTLTFNIVRPFWKTNVGLGPATQECLPTQKVALCTISLTNWLSFNLLLNTVTPSRWTKRMKYRILTGSLYVVMIWF